MTTTTTPSLTAEERIAYAAAFHSALSAVVEAPGAVDLVRLRAELERRLGASARPIVKLAIWDVFEGRPPRV